MATLSCTEWSTKSVEIKTPRSASASANTNTANSALKLWLMIVATTSDTTPGSCNTKIEALGMVWMKHWCTRRKLCSQQEESLSKEDRTSTKSTIQSKRLTNRWKPWEILIVMMRGMMSNGWKMPTFFQPITTPLGSAQKTATRLKSGCVNQLKSSREPGTNPKAATSNWHHSLRKTVSVLPPEWLVGWNVLPQNLWRSSLLWALLPWPPELLLSWPSPSLSEHLRNVCEISKS